MAKELEIESVLTSDAFSDDPGLGGWPSVLGFTSPKPMYVYNGPTTVSSYTARVDEGDALRDPLAAFETLSGFPYGVEESQKTNVLGLDLGLDTLDTLWPWSGKTDDQGMQGEDETLQGPAFELWWARFHEEYERSERLEAEYVSVLFRTPSCPAHNSLNLQGRSSPVASHRLSSPNGPRGCVRQSGVLRGQSVLRIFAFRLRVRTQFSRGDECRPSIHGQGPVPSTLELEEAS